MSYFTVRQSEGPFSFTAPWGEKMVARPNDVSILVWDMLDHLPIGYDVAWAVHSALFAYGMPLLDNALLEPLARVCVEEGRDEFMLVISPLPVVGGTGSPANPLAVF